MEGCIERLLDENNVESKKLLSQCNVYLMPNMNPDGSRRGHLRTNAAGRNLNREWANPEIGASPEVYFVKQAMQEIGVDFLLDVHGDESLPYCFIAGTEGLSNWDEQKQSQLDFYKTKLVELNADFQTEEGLPGEDARYRKPNYEHRTNGTGSWLSRHDTWRCLLRIQPPRRMRLTAGPVNAVKSWPIPAWMHCPVIWRADSYSPPS